MPLLVVSEVSCKPLIFTCCCPLIDRMSPTEKLLLSVLQMCKIKVCSFFNFLVVLLFVCLFVLNKACNPFFFPFLFFFLLFLIV